MGILAVGKRWDSGSPPRSFCGTRDRTLTVVEQSDPRNAHWRDVFEAWPARPPEATSALIPKALERRIPCHAFAQIPNLPTNGP
eukprot:10369720-Alexandrium_andersonii.AAC.1